ncbi:extensin-like domain-containing protein [Rhodomicrobium vannielii]|nr:MULTISPECIES: extensin family protein [Rhodomicrobium]
MLVCLAGLAAGVGLWSGYLPVPPQYNPFAPIDLTAPPNLLARFKLYRLKHDRALCLQALARTDAEFRPLEDQPGGQCPLVNIVRLSRAGAGFSRSFTASCPLAAAWEIFRHNTLQQAARAHFGQPVARVDHVGTYACRNVYNRPHARRSEHARANAIDVTGFVLADGTLISVQRDWNSKGQPAKAAFLRDIHQGACRAFNVVLGPDHNAAHANHFHFDMGSYWTCR